MSTQSAHEREVETLHSNAVAAQANRNHIEEALRLVNHAIGSYHQARHADDATRQVLQIARKCLTADAEWARRLVTACDNLLADALGEAHVHPDDAQETDDPVANGWIGKDGRP